MDRLKTIKGFLSLFGNPFYNLIEEKDLSWKNLVSELKKKWELPNDMSFSKFYELETALEINSKLPYHVQFSPNGNFMDNFVGKAWDKISWIVWENKIWSKPDIHAFVIDIDYHDTDYKNFEDLYDAIVDVFKDTPPSFIAMNYIEWKKTWWFHLYFLIDPEDKEDVSSILKKNDIKNINRYLHSQFPWWDMNESRYWISSRIRIPLTNHWKSWKPVLCNLFKWEKWLKFWDIKKNAIQSENDFKDLNYVTWDMVMSMLKVIKNNTQQKKDEMNIKKEYGKEKYNKINEIPFSKIFKALEKHPFDRKFTVRWADWSIKEINWILILEWNSIHIREKSSNILYPTNWYKYNKEENFVNSSFSWVNHPNRPQWNVFPFLKYYLWGLKSTEDFLFKNFNIKFSQLEMSEGENIMNEYKSPNGTFEMTFTDKRVYVTEIFKQNKRENLNIKNLLDEKIDVVCKTKTKLNQDFSESDTEEFAFIVKNKNWENILFKPVTTKRKFNDLYQSQIGFFYWNDDDVWKFFQALENIDFEYKELRHLSWFYEDWVVFWWKKVVTDSSNITNKYYDYFKNKNNLSTKKQIPVSHFISKLKSLYKDEVAEMTVLSFLSSISMNLFDDIEDQVKINTSIFFTWDTKSGKSSLKDIGKSMIWYEDKYREYAASSITPKPLKEAATSTEPLILEEAWWTNLKENIKSILRNIINRDKWSRWTASMKNLNYDYRSPIIAIWEEMTDEASINNRFCTINIKPSYQKIEIKNWVVCKDKFNEILEYTCRKEILESFSKYYNEKWYIKKAYNKSLKQLNEAGIVWREWEKFARILACNKLVYTGIKDEDAIESILFFLNRSWEINDSFIIQNDPAFRFKEMLIQSIMERKVIGRKYEAMYSWKCVWSIYEMTFMNWFVDKNRWRIADIISETDDFVWDRIFKVMSNTIIIKILDDNDKSKSFDYALSHLFNLLKVTHAEQVEDIVSLRDSFWG